MTKGIELPKEKIKSLGEMETYKYLGILEADTIKHSEMKEKKVPPDIEKTNRSQTT